MFCPNCHNIVSKGVTTCNECGFDKNKLDKSSHLDVTKARKEARFNDVIYYSYYPEDFDYFSARKKILLTGITGFHNFYLKKPIRGLILFGGFLYLLALITLLYIKIDIGFLNEFIGGFILVVLFFQYINDSIKILRKKLKVPIVLNQKLRK